MSHYPTDYLNGAGVWIRNAPGSSQGHDVYFMQMLSHPQVKIVYFGAHRHTTDNTTVLPTGTNPNWVVGGGGGWSCDGTATNNQGVVVGELLSDGSIENMRLLTVPRSQCCFPNPRHYDDHGHAVQNIRPADQVHNPFDHHGRKSRSRR